MTSPAAAPLSADQVRQYLDRIELPQVSQGDEPTLELLNQLIYAHQSTVAFSTADIRPDRPVPSLEIDDLFTKLVIDKHGGFCFELNLLFEKLLLSLGFDARPCLSRSVRGRIETAPINHRGELVRIDGVLHFADVGFGGPICAMAIPVADGAEVNDGMYSFICCKHDETWWRLDRITGGAKDIFGDSYEVRRQTELMFCEALVEDKDFGLLCKGLASPGSLFCDHLIVNLRTPGGYIGIKDTSLKVRGEGDTQEVTFGSDAERDHFMQELVGFVPYKN